MYSTIQIFKEIKRGELADSYLLVGEEEYLKEKVLKTILGKILPEEETTFDKIVMHGDSVTTEEIMSTLSSSPMVASKKVVIIREVHLLDTNGKSELLKYLANPVKSTCLILVAPKVDLEKGFFNEASKMARLYHFRRLTAGESSQLVLSHLKKHGMSITREAKELLLENVGSETHKLINELDKLVLYKSGSKRIERRDTEKLVDFGRLESIFKLQDLVGKRRVREALEVIEQLLFWNEKPIRILASLGSFYLTLLKLKHKPKHTSLEVFSKKLKLSNFYIKKCNIHLDNFSEKELISALKLTNQKELEMKEGAGCFRSLLTTYINQLCSL